MKNKKIISHPLTVVYCLLSAFCFLASCSNEDEEVPRLDSVWYNMVAQPVEQATCAYPGQTVCLHGEHLGDLRRVIVNGTDINLNTLYVYESETAITFQLPTDVNTVGDLIRVVTAWGKADLNFIVRPANEKPEITAFSATTLIPGRTLTITGQNLGGAKEVWLPLVFDGRARCEMDTTQDSDDTTVHVTVPEGVSFASGRCEIVMEKYDEVRGMTYTEKVYSTWTDFK